MLKFIRNIRKRLFFEPPNHVIGEYSQNNYAAKSGNKFSRYLIYAVGEIILVVIGILIALQINNWNETNKINKEEQKLLTQLNEDFNENMLRLEETINLEKKVINDSKALIKIMQTKNTDVDSDSIVDYVVSAKSWYRTEFVTGTYNSMLGSGNINTLSNDTLKRLLAQFSAEVEAGFEDQYESINYTIELNKISANLIPAFIKEDQLLRLGMSKNQEIINTSINEFIHNDDILGLVLIKTWLEINRLDYLYKIQGYIEDIRANIISGLEK